MTAVTGSPAEVLVVGAGPSGLFAAAELARHGVRARIVERRPGPHREARATALQPGTLELLARAGILEAALAASVHVEWARMFDADLRQVGGLTFTGIDCACEFECSLPQWRTEQILAERLAELGGAVEHGVAVSSLEARDDGVLVGLEHADGTRESVEAGWVVGAGGAHSVTRASMGEDLDGWTYPGTALVADVRVRCALPRDGSALIATPQGYVLLAPLPGERWITFVGDLAGDEAEALVSAAPADVLAATFARRVGDRVVVDDVGWASTFRMHNRLAARLADGRRFLLGDAGHLSSPFGGEGLNSGLHDANDVAWKLALTLRGRGRPALLESFEPERRTADQHVLEVSNRVHEMVGQAVDSARTGIPGTPSTPDEAAAFARARALLDLSYAGSPIVGEDAGERYPGRGALAGTTHHLLLHGGVDDAGVERLRRRWAGLVQILDGAGEGAGAILVRPDGHVGFRAARADADGLAALDAHLDSYLVPA